MKRLAVLPFCLGGIFIVLNSQAVDLKQAKLTQVVNEVQIISLPAQTPKAAAVNDIFSMPDVLHTGDASRAELMAKDETITRVGANTIFSFDPASRTIDLKQGSLLFHSPHGRGGGTIRTGSATASVLGTTLIVSTTPNGGMKVLDLEGQVEVKFLNRLKQQLSPGQMTFILPGGKQLAPIIVFRLDELVKKSLLVDGFGKPLPSLPLIKLEIDRQLKLIKSGRANDTGLLVGDSASANQVEVLDPNTIQSHVANPASGKAIRSDATISSSSLTDPKIPTPPKRVFLNQPFLLPGNSFFANQSFKGFAARNINFLPGFLLMDMSTYASQPKFDFVAAQDLQLNGTLTFSGLSSGNQLSLNAGNQITFKPGVILTADAGRLNLASPGSLSLDSVMIFNNQGDVSATTKSSITLNNTIIQSPGHLTLTAPKEINLAWDSTIAIGQPGDNTFTTDAGKGAVTITSRNGNLTLADTSIQAHYLTLNSGDSILLDASGRTLKATGAGATATFAAPRLITVNNANLASYGVVNMAANTLNLSDVAFGANSSVTLKSQLGELNLGSSVPGYVNFIRNVTYGGDPAQNHVNNGGGITVTKLH